MIFFKLFWTFFKIGLFTFGGGFAMLPLVQQEVIGNGWLKAEELINFIAISESTPGPLAVNISSFVGMQTAGFGGAFFATLGVVLPSFVIILIIAGMYERFQSNRHVNGALIGLKGAVVGLIGVAIINTCISVFNNMIKTKSINEIIASVFLIIVLSFGIKKKIHPIFLIFASAILGILIKNII